MEYARATSFPPALRGCWLTITKSYRQREPLLSQGQHDSSRRSRISVRRSRDAGHTLGRARHLIAFRAHAIGSSRAAPAPPAATRFRGRAAARADMGEALLSQLEPKVAA
jgi:hypothetical protein